MWNKKPRDKRGQERSVPSQTASVAAGDPAVMHFHLVAFPMMPGGIGVGRRHGANGYDSRGQREQSFFHGKTSFLRAELGG
jgi:hypothetical protein